MNRSELLAEIQSTNIAKLYALDWLNRRSYNQFKQSYRWTNYKHSVDIPTYMRLRLPLQRMTHYYDFYTETLYLSRWVYQDNLEYINDD